MAIDHDLSHKREQYFLIEIAKRQLIVLVILSSKWKLFDQSYVNAKWNNSQIKLEQNVCHPEAVSLTAR